MSSSMSAAGMRVGDEDPVVRCAGTWRTRRPDVLPDHQGRGAVRVEGATDLLEVLLAEEVLVLDAEGGEGCAFLRGRIREFDRGDVPSSSFVMITRSRTLMVPESCSSLMAGMISPENLLPGKPMAMYSTGPMLMP